MIRHYLKHINSVLLLLAIICSATACRKGVSTSAQAEAEAEVELYLVDTSVYLSDSSFNEGLSLEEMDGYVESAVTTANSVFLSEVFAGFLIKSPTWPIKDLSRTQDYIRFHVRVHPVGDAVRDTVTIRVSNIGDEDTVEIANQFAAFLVNWHEHNRARRVAEARAALAEQIESCTEKERDALLSLWQYAKENDYNVKDVLEPDEVESHPAVLNYRVELETLKELKVQLEVDKARGRTTDDFEQAIKNQEVVLKEAVAQLADADVRSALIDSAKHEAEFLLDLQNGTLRAYKDEYDVYSEALKRLQVIAELMPVEGVAISPMLVQRHGAELIE